MITQSVQEQASPGFTSDGLLLPNAKFQLYPFLIRRSNSKDYSLIRLGCQTVTVVSTTQCGVVASRLLKSGHSAAETCARVSSKFKCKRVDLLHYF
jgi:hypothetical protein